MAIINYTDQLKYAGRGYLDAKMMPVKTVDDLKAISLTQRFEGLTITVLNDGNPQDYWLVGGITNKNWIPKTTGGDYSELRLVLEDGFLKLMNGQVQLGESVNLNEFFPEGPINPEESSDLYIASVDYTTSNDKGEKGIFMCFTYSNDTSKYLDMSQFLPQIYQQGSGIVIEGNVISLDDAIVGRITNIEAELEKKVDLTALNAEIENRESSINEVKELITNEENSRIIEDVKLKSDIEKTNQSISSLETKLESYTLKSVNSNDKVIEEIDGVISANIEMVYEENTIYLKGKKGEIISSIDASSFLKDGMLKSVRVDNPIEGETGKKYLVLSFNTDAGLEDIRIDMSEFSESYVAGDGLELNDGIFTIKLDDTNNSYLQITTNGISISEELIDKIDSLNENILNEVKTYVDNSFVKNDTFNAFTSEINSKFEEIESTAKEDKIEKIKVNGIEASIEDKVASVKIESDDIEVGVSITSNGEEIYPSTQKISSVLQGIQDSISVAVSGGLTGVVGDKGIEVSPVVANKQTVSIKISNDTNNLIQYGEDGGIFAAMYYDGDDIEN